MFLHTTVQHGLLTPANAGGGGAGVPQTLTLNGTQIAISGGNSIDIGPIVNTNDLSTGLT